VPNEEDSTNNNLTLTEQPIIIIPVSINIRSANIHAYNADNNRSVEKKTSQVPKEIEKGRVQEDIFFWRRVQIPSLAMLLIREFERLLN